MLRVHAGRAKEFTSKAVQRWCTERQLVNTYTTGSDWKSNGRAEGELGMVKRHAKILMKAHDISEGQWPLAVRHAAARRLRWQLQQCGVPVPALMPYHTKVMVKRKSWNNRYGQWRWERAPGKICGPDPWSSMTSNGYCVQLEDGKYVASTDALRDYPEPGEPPEIPEVEKRPEVGAEQPAPVVPRRRLRFKQPEPRIAVLEEEETQALLKIHNHISKVLSEECCLIDGLQSEHASCIPALSMLAHQKFDVECQLQALELEQRAAQEDFLVTKTVATEQVYNNGTSGKMQ